MIPLTRFITLWWIDMLWLKSNQKKKDEKSHQHSTSRSDRIAYALSLADNAHLIFRGQCLTPKKPLSTLITSFSNKIAFGYLIENGVCCGYLPHLDVSRSAKNFRWEIYYRRQCQRNVWNWSWLLYSHYFFLFTS